MPPRATAKKGRNTGEVVDGEDAGDANVVGHLGVAFKHVVEGNGDGVVEE